MLVPNPNTEISPILSVAATVASTIKGGCVGNYRQLHGRGVRREAVKLALSTNIILYILLLHLYNAFGLWVVRSTVAGCVCGAISSL